MACLPQWHYLHLEQDVLPYLREHGVTEEQIDAMLVDNPRRYFERLTAYFVSAGARSVLISGALHTEPG